MLIIDNITIVLGIIVLLLTVTALLMDPFVRYKAGRRMLSFKEQKVQEEQEETSESADNPDKDPEAQHLPMLSIILTPHNQAEALEKNLPLLLRQDYPAGYQVIVVREVSDHDTEDVLKRQLHDLNVDPSDASLYVTSIQDSSRFMSRKKLAVTLGVKAAKTDWILLMEADCRPQSDRWLRVMASHCYDSTRMVIGYTAYAPEATVYQRFERIHTAYYLLREDEYGIAYRTNCPHLMIRKDDFMKGEGYLGNLHLIHGEYDFLVNKFSNPEGTSVEFSPEAWTIEDAPSHRTWMNHRVFYQETRRFLNRSLPHRALFNADQSFLHLAFWVPIAAMVLGGLSGRWVLLAIAVIAWLALIIIRSIIGKKAVSVFDDTIGTARIFCLEMSVVWHNASAMFHHCTADKLEFTTHKQ